MIYNLNGMVNFKGINDIIIVFVVFGFVVLNEVVEIKGVSVFGKLNINYVSLNVNSVFWFGGGMVEVNIFIVEENVDVMIFFNGIGMFYCLGVKLIDIDVKKNVKLVIIFNNNIFWDILGGVVKIVLGVDVIMIKIVGGNLFLWVVDDIIVSFDVCFILNKIGGIGYII